MADEPETPDPVVPSADPVVPPAEPKKWPDPVKTYSMSELKGLKEILFPSIPSPSDILPTTSPNLPPKGAATPILPASVEEEAPAPEEAPELAPATKPRRKVRWI